MWSRRPAFLFLKQHINNSFISKRKGTRENKRLCQDLLFLFWGWFGVRVAQFSGDAWGQKFETKVFKKYESSSAISYRDCDWMMDDYFIIVDLVPGMSFTSKTHRWVNVWSQEVSWGTDRKEKWNLIITGCRKQGDLKRSNWSVYGRTKLIKCYKD